MGSSKHTARTKLQCYCLELLNIGIHDLEEKLNRGSEGKVKKNMDGVY